MATAVKLYGPLLSPAVARVLVCILEKQLPYQLIPVDLRKGQQKKPEFLALNPFGKVPVFQDGSLTLFESRAIVRYVADQYEAQGTVGLLGKNPAEKAIVEQWIEAESQSFSPPSSSLAFQLFFGPMRGVPPDEKEIQKNEEKLNQVLDVYEKRLSESKYLAGDEVTIADLSHLPNMEILMKCGEKAELITSRKNVNEWWNNISSRESWKKVVELKNPSKQ